MKRILCVLLSVCMLFSIPLWAMSMGNNSEKQTSAVDFLYTLGFIEYDKFGNYPVEVSATRKEFCAIASKILDINSNNTFKGYFTDVTETTEYFGEIEALYEAGFISGDGAQNFRPDDYISYNEAIKVLVSMLGYKLPAEMAGGYPGGYMLLAGRLDILDGVIKETHMTKGNLAVLVRNALEAPTFEETEFTNDGYSADSTGETLLYRHHSIDVIEGVFNADSYTSLSSNGGFSENTAIIANSTFKCNFSNKSDFLGLYVKGYYNYDTEELLYCEVSKSKNNVIEIDDEGEPDYTDGKLTYLRDSGGRRSVNLSSSVKTVYNGKLITTFNENYYSIKNGSIRLISNNGDDTYDVVIINDYKALIVDMLDYNNQKLYVKNSSEPYISLSGVDMEFYDENGNIIDWSYITEWSCLSTLISDDKKLMKFYKSDGAIPLKIDAISDEYVYDENGNEYKVDENYETYFKEIKLGDTGTYFTDIFGNICGKFEGDKRKAEPAYLTGFERSRLGKSFQIGFVSERSPRDNKVIAVTIDGSLKIDGDKLKADAAADRIESLMNSTTEKFCLLYYNEEGKLTEIDTLLTSASEDPDTALYHDYTAGAAEEDYVLFRPGNGFAGKSIVSNNFKVIYVPPHAADEMPAVEGIAVRNGTSCFNSGESYNNFSVYRTGKESLVADYVIYNQSASGRAPGSFSTYQRLSIVTKKTYAYCELEDAIFPKITYVTAGTQEEKFVVDEEIANELTPGDIVRVSVNSEDRIDNYKRYFNAATGKLENHIEGELWDNAKTDYIERSMYGNVYMLKDGVVLLTKHDPANLESMAINSLTARGEDPNDEDLLRAEIRSLCEAYRLPSSVGKYDKDGPKGEKYTPSGEKEIRSYEEYGDAYSKLYLFSIYSTAYDAFILENF